MITCEEKARVDSFCPKHGVCHPRLELMMSIRVILMIMMYQLLRGLGGAWKRKSLQVAKFPQCKVRRGKIKFWRGEIKVRRGEFKVRRGKIKAQPNKKTKPSSSTQVQAEVIQRCFQKKTFEIILGLLGERETGNWRMKESGRGRSCTKLGGIFDKPGFECLSFVE